MKIIAIQTAILKNKPLAKIISQIKTKNIPLANGDVLVVTSKVVSLDENRLVKLADVKASDEANQLAKIYDFSPEYSQVIIDEADEILEGVKRAILTIKSNILIANAGADTSNVPPGYAVIWPKNPVESAQRIKNLVKKEFGFDVGVIITDSHCLPLRRGTIGIALAVAGFEPLTDDRGRLDLFDKKLKITYHNLADDLSSAANLVMGEYNQRIPAVIIKNAPIMLSQKSAQTLTNQLKISKREDLFNKLYK